MPFTQTARRACQFVQYGLTYFLKLGRKSASQDCVPQTLSFHEPVSLIFSLINSLFLYSERDILQITSLQYILRPANPLRHLPNLRNAILCNILCTLFFGSFPFLTDMCCTNKMVGVARSVFLISLSLQLSAAYCPILHHKDLFTHLPKS